MPLGVKPRCVECGATESTLWEKTASGLIQCSKCFSVNARRLRVNLFDSICLSPDRVTSDTRVVIVSSPVLGPVTDPAASVEGAEIRSSSETNGDGAGVCEEAKASGADDIISMETEGREEGSERKPAGNTGRGATYCIRKSSRIKPVKVKSQSNAKALATKGRGRRIIFKRNPMRAPPSVATVVTRDNIFHGGSYWQTGDIVSVLDEGGGVYYAQIRGFLQDQYMERSAVITWLIPTSAPSDAVHFRPDNYVIGPEEDLPRRMDCFEFVCHAPSDYYQHARGAPPPIHFSTLPQLGFIWTRLSGPQILPLENLLSPDSRGGSEGGVEGGMGDGKKKEGREGVKKIGQGPGSVNSGKDKAKERQSRF